MLRKRSWWGVAIVLVFALLSILRFKVGEAVYQVYIPVGYIKQVDELIDQGKLTYQCRDESIQVENLSPAEEYFLDNSYLEDDIEAWNQGDRRAFVVSREERRGGSCRGELIRSNPSHHNQRLPTYSPIRWKGDLYVRAGNVGTVLTSPQRSLEVVSPEWDRLPLPAQVFEEVGFGARAEDLRSPKLGLVSPGRRTMFASLKNLGDETVVESLEDPPEITLNGCRVPLGWRLRLDPGDSFRVRDDRSRGTPLDEHFIVETGDRAGLVSFVSQVNGQLRRRTFTDRLSIAREIAVAVDSVTIAGSDREGSRDDFDVYLTVDSFLDQRLENLMAEFMNRYGGRPLRAAVTVMEAEEGRVLSLASYPTSDDLDVGRRRQRWNQLDRLGQNHNFLQHTVGSAAKPFLAAAALETFPQLADLETQCVPTERNMVSLAGVEIDAPYFLPSDCQGADAEGWVDFRSFLEVSSNRYMLYLGLLALADWESGVPAMEPGAPSLHAEEQWRLGQRVFTRRPKLSVLREERDGLLAELNNQEFFRHYRDLFAHRVEYREGLIVDRIDQRLWQPIIDVSVADPRHLSIQSFSNVTPEWVDLRVNLAQSLRRDLYTMLLGNGTNRWSNIHLAEAMARLVTGRQVKARLIEKLVVPGEPEEEGLLGLGTVLGQDDGAGNDATESTENVLWTRGEDEAPPLELGESQRQLILESLLSVVEETQGTARSGLSVALEALNDAAPEGVTYTMRGKTGTPTLPEFIVRNGPTDAAPDAVLVASGQNQVRSAVFVTTIERNEVGGESADADETSILTVALYIEAQGGSREAVDLMARLLGPLARSYWPADWL